MGASFSVSLSTHNDFEIAILDGSVEITNYTGNANEIRIPESINGLPVVSIGERAFNLNRLTSVYIPNSVSHIGDRAFASNQLTSVSIPANVDIQPYSFPLIVVYKQYNLNGRAETTFSISLSAYNNFEIAILNGSMVEITNYTGNANEIRIPERINGMPVIAIGGGAFVNNQLTSIAIGNSVSYIGGSAFFRNQLTSVSIPNSVSYIGGGAFAGNRLTSVSIGNSVSHIGGGAFAGNRLTSVSIGNSVSHIGEAAFSFNQLTYVSIPSHTYIGNNAFDWGVVITRR